MIDENDKVTIWYLVSNGGDGSAYPNFYLTEAETEAIDELEEEGFAECCNGIIETYKGSNVHLKALKNSEQLPALLKELKEESK